MNNKIIPRQPPDAKALADTISADYIDDGHLTGKPCFTLRFRSGQWFSVNGHGIQKITMDDMRTEIAQKLSQLRQYPESDNIHITKRLADDILLSLSATEGIYIPKRQPIDSENELRLIKFSDIPSQEINWLWLNKFPKGAISTLSGDPGAKKSYFTHYMASVVSMGGKWPDCPEPIQRGSVIIVSDEDDPEKVIRPRLDVHKADLSKIYIVTGEGFNIKDHLTALENTLTKLQECKLIIIDPITAYLADANANSNTEVRSILTPLASLAARHDVCIIAINHLNKRQDSSYIYRGLGSQGFVALARSAWAIVADKEDDDVSILAPIKSNYCISPTGLKFRIIDGVLQFEKEVWTGRIDDTGRNSTKRIDQACDWLRKRLGDEAIASDLIFDEGKEQGFGRGLLYDAQKKLGIKPNKEGWGKEGAWFWKLPEISE